MTDNLIAEMVFKQLMTTPENTKCFDCGKQNNIKLLFQGMWILCGRQSITECSCACLVRGCTGASECRCLRWGLLLWTPGPNANLNLCHLGATKTSKTTLKLTIWMKKVCKLSIDHVQVPIIDLRLVPSSIFKLILVAMHGRGSTLWRIWEALLWLGPWGNYWIGSTTGKWDHSQQPSLLRCPWGGQGRGTTITGAT